MENLTQKEIDEVNRLHDGVLEGFTVQLYGWIKHRSSGKRMIGTPEWAAITRLVRALLSAEKQSVVWIDGETLMWAYEHIRSTAKNMRLEQDDPRSDLKNLRGWATSLDAIADRIAPPASKEPEWEVTPTDNLTVKVWRSNEDGGLCCSDCDEEFWEKGCPHIQAVNKFSNGDGPFLVTRKEGKQ